MRSTRALLIGAVAGVLVVIASVLLVLPAEARPTASMVLSPSVSTARVGQTVTTTLTVDVRNAQTNAVQADLAFPARLGCGTVQVDRAVWGVTAQSTCANGRLTLALGSFVPRQGKLPVATITWRALSPGTAPITFVPETQVLQTPSATRLPLRAVPARVVVAKR